MTYTCADCHRVWDGAVTPIGDAQRSVALAVRAPTFFRKRERRQQRA